MRFVMWELDMRRQLVIIGTVAAAVVLVLWLKSKASGPTGEVASGADAAEASEPAYVASVVLFADPREASSRCGCGEIIRIARGAASVPGVVLLEFDARDPGEPAERFGVRVSPTVIITAPDGRERVRFEGESPEVIAGLRSAVATLGSDSVRAGEGPPP